MLFSFSPSLLIRHKFIGKSIRELFFFLYLSFREVKQRLQKLNQKEGVDGTSEILKEFFADIEDLKLEEQWKFLNVLKTVNQEAIAPCVAKMRELIYEQFPYKDVKGSWRISIDITKSSAIVHHRKKEQSHKENFFSFFWQLKIEYPFLLNPN